MFPMGVKHKDFGQSDLRKMLSHLKRKTLCLPEKQLWSFISRCLASADLTFPVIRQSLILSDLAQRYFRIPQSLHVRNLFRFLYSSSTWMYLKPFDVEINSLSKRCYGLPSPEIGDIAGERGLEIGERNLEAFGRTGITIKTWEIVSTRNKVPKIEIDFITNLI